MEIPDLLRHRLEGEPRNGVALDGNAVTVFTRDRTLIYREESLLSDATVEVYDNDIERLSVSQGRRKTTFELEYIDDTRQFVVPSSHAEAMLEGLFGGILVSAGVTEDSEEIRGVYLFSDLTLVVTDSRLVKHVGPAVWGSDPETYPFSAVTGLEFEEGEVATQVVLWVDDRAERIKTPNEEAPLLRRTLTRALCAFHGVDSLEQLNESLGTGTDTDDDPAPHSSIALEEEISPLIEGTDEQESTVTDTIDAVADDNWLEPDNDTDQTEPADDGGVSVDDRADDGETDGELGERIDTLERRVSELTRTVDQQNKLLERQSRHLSALAEQVDTDR
ncbi:MAG: hypothetical protein J07HX64_00800 [halophilic archaeon J07HX64]|jgi:hypothetical protein|nr:MAG: hypothetical protein J07HX64_00800 [halophilic archaeon J07HX64]